MSHRNIEMHYMTLVTDIRGFYIMEYFDVGRGHKHLKLRSFFFLLYTS